MKKIETVKSSLIFNDIINHGNKVATPYFIICSAKNNKEDKNLFGVAVGTKVGNAVTRNKLKRQIRRIIDNNKLLFQKNMIYIIIGKKECLKAKFDDMDKIMREALLKGEKNEK